MTQVRPWLWFAAVQTFVLLMLFGDGLWGRSLLVPVDIAATQFSKFAHLGDGKTTTPANHHTIDALTYDLPVQYSIHRAFARGEIPWWDPYTFAGWPMLAESHSHGFDPARVLAHLTLPFELAYNWARAFHFFLCGLGMFVLMRRFDFSAPISTFMAAAWQCAGGIAFYFQQPWIPAMFGWLPFLWVAWDGAFRTGRWSYSAAASLVVSASLFSGSLQSHSYLALFAMALGFGYSATDLRAWRRWLVPVAISGLVGSCLAAPVLLNEIDLFLNSTRDVAARASGKSALSGVLSLAAFYPWGLGTFKTLDASRLVGQNILGFCLFIGSAAVLLAPVGASAKTDNSKRVLLLRAAKSLVLLYFIILFTPLLHIFYNRCSALAGMGLVLLAAHGLEVTLSRPSFGRRAGWYVAGLAVAVAIGVHVGAWVIYPRLLPRVREIVTRHDQSAKTFDSAPGLRAHQIEILPDQITFKNPHAAIAWLSMAGLAVWLLRPQWRNEKLLLCLLMTNLLPVVLVAGDYIPKAPREQWIALRDGGPEQARVQQTLSAPLRLRETAPGVHDMVMPLALPMLYQVRAVHGYASVPPQTVETLQPKDRASIPKGGADWIYESSQRGIGSGVLHSNALPGLARFGWLDDSTRVFRVQDKGACVIQVAFEEGRAGRFAWRDTRYPGWSATADGKSIELGELKPCFSVIDIPATACRLELTFRPRFLTLGLRIACGGAVFLLLLLTLSLRQSKRRGFLFEWPRRCPNDSTDA